jgi:uncharacterized membrane protein
MSELIVIGFDDEHTAFEMRAALAKLQKEYLIDMEDVVVVTKDDKDKVCCRGCRCRCCFREAFRHRY